MKAGNIDVMYGLKADDFIAFKKNERITQSFNLYTPVSLQYAYLGINTKLPKFSDKRTRQALAYLTDADGMLHYLMNDLGQRTSGFIHPSDTLNYNKDIPLYPFDVNKAKALLAEAGWTDSDKDGILDKMINGEKVDLRIRFTVNAGNNLRKMVAETFQLDAQKAGVAVDIVTQDWSVYLEHQKNHDFEMFYGSWIATPVPNDPKQVYHSESANGGSNYTSFGTAASDALIDSIRVELDENKRAGMYKRLQVILHEEVSYIYLWAPTERIAISKRFSHAEVSAMRPGFWAASFH